MLVNHVGDFGLFQKTVVILLSVASAGITSQNLVHTFLGKIFIPS